MKKIAVIGSTVSIGKQTLDVIGNHRDKFEVVALAANKNKALIKAQAQEFSVENVGLFSEIGEKCYELASLPNVDVVVIAADGISAMGYLLAAIRAGKKIALANKECVVSAWELLKPLIKKHGATVFPVDSEHSAIKQSLSAGRRKVVRRLVLTASGGPFFGRSKDELENVTIKEALKHPTWQMGAKITIDSATMMNKGLEVIEACRLFDIDEKNVEVVVHRESVVHSLVEYVDGAVVAELSYPTMEIPIQLALSYPKRFETTVKPLDLAALSKLSFYSLDEEAFPFVKLCRRALSLGGFCPLAVSSADEEAVAAFLAGRISFGGIYKVVEKTLDRVSLPEFSLENIPKANRLSRLAAKEIISEMG